MKSAIWGLIKIVLCTSALWAAVLVVLAFVASNGWNAFVGGAGVALPTVTFGTAYAGLSAVFAVIVAVRLAVKSPFLNVVKEYGELTWQAIFWPPQ